MKSESSGKLFLSGGGDASQSALIDKLFVDSLKVRSLLYIPVALERSTVGFEACYDWIINALSTQTDEFLDIVMWTGSKGEQLPDFSQFGGIYLGGGNSYRLLNIIKSSGLDKRIISFLCDGKSVYGGSAGAIVMGKDIRTVIEENIWGYPDSAGLSLCGAYSLICHYTSTKDREIMRYIESSGNPVMAIPESCGIDIDGRKVLVVGDQPVSVFNENLTKSQLKPGDTLLL